MGFLLFLGALPPMALILGAAIFLILGIISLAQGERTKCGNCGKFNTMISVTSPQGKRLLKECGAHPDENEEPASNSIHDSPEDRILKLLKLKEVGIVSEDEYEEKRRKILAEI